jgi:DnaJ-class molecular chaperone
VKLCSSCHGRGGMVIDENYQIDWESCMECNGYGVIHEVTYDD